MHKIVMTERIDCLPSNAILMIFWLSFIHAHSRRVVIFEDACISSFAGGGFFATGFAAPKVLNLARRG